MTRMQALVTATIVFAFSAAPASAALIVRSVDIVNGEVKTVDLANAAVTNKKFATNAVNGAKLDESTLGIVPNANQLDGRDSTTFVAGSGRVVAGSATINRGNYGAIFSAAVADQIGFNVAYLCPGSLDLPLIEFRNKSTSTQEVWYQDGGDDPQYVEVAAGANSIVAAFQETHSFKFRIFWRSTARQATLIYSLTGKPFTCLTDGFATVFN